MNPLLISWGAWKTLQLGRPSVSLGFFGGAGDDLLCTTPIRELLARGSKRIWFHARFPDLYRYTDKRVRVVPEDGRYLRLAERLGAPFRPLSYAAYEEATDRDLLPADHIAVAMCRIAGIKGRVLVRPWLDLSDAERASASKWKGYVAIQSSSMTAAAPMRNKQWRTERLQAVVSDLAGSVRFVQLGAHSDPKITGAEDMRGRSSMRDSAAILSQCSLFLGLAGFTMHLARSVDCRSVIVYGGRETPAMTGYPCNVNLTTTPSCSPCLARSRCAHDHVCMDMITADKVREAVSQALANPPLALMTEEVEL